MKQVSDRVRGYLFQSRIGSCVVNERHLLAAARYVELNLVRAGIVKEAVDYPWSSARFYLGVSQGDILVGDTRLLGLVDDWGEYLKGKDEPSVQTTLLQGIRTGRPAGSAQFVALSEKVTDRDLGVRKAGRPLQRASWK